MLYCGEGKQVQQFKFLQMDLVKHRNNTQNLVLSTNPATTMKSTAIKIIQICEHMHCISFGLTYWGVCAVNETHCFLKV